MQFRIAAEEDLPKIRSFIETHWQNNHILAKNEKFLKYQHSWQNKLSFIIAEENDIIYGLQGYIPMNNEVEPDISGAMWKVIPSNYFMLGKALKEQLKILTNFRYMCSPGININTAGKVIGMYGQTVGKMEHYYRILDLPEYHIAKIKKKIIPITQSDRNKKLVQIFDYNKLDRNLTEEYLKTKIPYKNKNYLRHRYQDHPVYHYDFYAIKSEIEDIVSSFIIMREININDRKIAKIVDFIGEDEDLKGLSHEWDKLMQEKGYEYIDFYCYGIADEILKDSGFIKRDEEDQNIIPNYFEPFEQRNVDIYFSTNHIEGLHLYRGDGDQDRPSYY